MQRYLFFFSHPDFDNGEFYAAKKYIHLVQEGSEEYLFDVPVPSVRRARKYVIAQVNKEQVEGKNIATYLLSIFSGQRGNLNDDDMNKLREQVLYVNTDNFSNPENVPETTPVANNDLPVLNWNTDCIV